MKCTRNGERVKMCIRATNERRRIQIDVLRIEIVHNCFCIAFITKSVNYFHRPYCTYFICYTVLKNSFKSGVCVCIFFVLSFFLVGYISFVTAWLRFEKYSLHTNCTHWLQLKNSVFLDHRLHLCTYWEREEKNNEILRVYSYQRQSLVIMRKAYLFKYNCFTLFYVLFVLHATFFSLSSSFRTSVDIIN